MISIARNFGAPVMLPPGKTQATAKGDPATAGQPAFDGGNEVLHLRKFFEPGQFRHLHRAICADFAQIIRQQVVIITNSASSLALVCNS